jgi:GT2 family glycosyltransferase
MTELAFVMSPKQNWFFKELVAAIRDELDRQGIPSSLHTDGFPPPQGDRVYVLVPPHEYAALEGAHALPGDDVLCRTIFLCAEQPHTVHFRQNLELAERAGAVFDINRAAVARFQEAGITTRHFQLGYTPTWDRFDPDRVRDIDVVFLGCRTQRRLKYLNRYARVLSRWNCHIQISDNSRPNIDGSTSFLANEKWDLLSRAKLVINLHQSERRYFEWLRVVDAIHCGAVIVSEHSTEVEPLEPGNHLFTGRPESLALIADALLRDDARISRTRAEAYSFIRSSLPMARSAAALAGAARILVAQPLPRRIATAVRRTAGHPKPPDPFPPPTPKVRTEADLVRRELKEIRLSQMDIMRQLAGLQHRFDARNGGREIRSIERAYETDAWRARRSVTVTVLTALYNQGHLLGSMLDSVVRSEFRDFELVVVDDGSTDGSGEAAKSWMRSHGDIPALLVRHTVNRGLGAARNTALAFARGRYCLVLDADNEIYPRCIPALMWTLETDTEAAFAYPILETFGAVEQYISRGHDAFALVSHLGWEPRRLRIGNYIDALAMIRTQVLRELGGYTTDKRCHGWEDYDLWCAAAERGFRGRLVPQMLARYRVSPTSMLSLTDFSPTTALHAMIERHPELMAEEAELAR